MLPTRWGSTCKRFRKGKLLSPCISNKGYVGVSVNDENVGVHRLVALAFYGKPRNSKMVVNHKDGNKANNTPDNLEWVTSSENELHSHRVLGKISWNKGLHWVNKRGISIRKNNYIEKCKIVFDMVENKNMSIQCVADILEINIYKVKRRLNYAKEVIYNGEKQMRKIV
jgi:hypothetical protein